MVGWGRGKEGQLGIEGNPFAAQPKVISGTTKLPAAEAVEALAAGQHCSLVALRQGPEQVSLWWLGQCPNLAQKQGGREAGESEVERRAVLACREEVQPQAATQALAGVSTIAVGVAQAKRGGGGVGSSRRAVGVGVMGPGVDPGLDGCASCKAKAFLLQRLQGR